MAETPAPVITEEPATPAPTSLSSLSSEEVDISDAEAELTTSDNTENESLIDSNESDNEDENTANEAPFKIDNEGEDWGNESANNIDNEGEDWESSEIDAVDNSGEDWSKIEPTLSLIHI